MHSCFTHDTIAGNYSDRYAHFTNEKMRSRVLHRTSPVHEKAAWRINPGLSGPQVLCALSVYHAASKSSLFSSSSTHTGDSIIRYYYFFYLTETVTDPKTVVSSSSYGVWRAWRTGSTYRTHMWHSLNLSTVCRHPGCVLITRYCLPDTVLSMNSSRNLQTGIIQSTP